MIYYRGDELFAIRKGVFKAHFQTAPGYAAPSQPLKFEPHDPPLLFKLDEDPGEKFDVAKDHPEIMAEIQHILDEHRKGLVPGKAQY
jgi:arylsulfatase A-like enzyme